MGDGGRCGCRFRVGKDAAHCAGGEAGFFGNLGSDADVVCSAPAAETPDILAGVFMLKQLRIPPDPSMALCCRQVGAVQVLCNFPHLRSALI